MELSTGLEWVALLLGGWLAATISGAAGFGGALLLLPLLTFIVGAKAAIPILTLAQLLGNVSRAGFGFRDIHWRPALRFSAGAIPASVLGARLFVSLPSSQILRLVGAFLILVVILRHTGLGKRTFPSRWLPAAGAVVGFLSAVVGSAGPLGAAVFFSLHLPPVAYVASEAVTASLMHATKSLVYGRYAAISGTDALMGLTIGASMVIGSWTGRRIIRRMPERWFGTMIEIMLIVAAISLVFA